MRVPQKVRIALAGGGSGGHLYPGLALSSTLMGVEERPFLYGSGKRDESGWVGEMAKPVAMDAPHLPGRGRQVPRYLCRLFRAVERALAEMRRRRPHLVVGLGGYASVAPGLAALISRRPLLLLEQNVVPGKANLLLARLGGRMAASFEKSLCYLSTNARRRARVVGNPVRQELLDGGRDPARFGLSSDRPVLLVTGGSQGAEGLNDRVSACASVMAERGAQVLHLAGPSGCEGVRERYGESGVRSWVAGFSHEMGALYRTADLVLCRAGGTTLAELAMLGKASVLVPYPHHRDRHQELNARVLVEAGAASMVGEAELDDRAFCEQVMDLLFDRERLQKMESAAQALAVPDAARRAADWARELMGSRFA